MDKVLAFSILSASPADIAAGAGEGGCWARLRWRRGKPDERVEQRRQVDQAPAEATRRQQRGKEGSPDAQQGKERRRPEEMRPRFALEFDGIDCFETIVLH